MLLGTYLFVGTNRFVGTNPLEFFFFNVERIFYGVLGINVKRDQLVGNNLGLNTQIHSFKEKTRS